MHKAQAYRGWQRRILLIASRRASRQGGHKEDIRGRASTAPEPVWPGEPQPQQPAPLVQEESLQTSLGGKQQAHARKIGLFSWQKPEPKGILKSTYFSERDVERKTVSFAKRRTVRLYRAADNGLTRIPVSTLRNTAKIANNKGSNTIIGSNGGGVNGENNFTHPSQLRLCMSQLTLQLAAYHRAGRKPESVSEEQWTAQIQRNITRKLEELNDYIAKGTIATLQRELQFFTHSDFLCDPNKRGGDQLGPHGPWCFCMGGMRAWRNYAELHSENDNATINATNTTITRH